MLGVMFVLVLALIVFGVMGGVAVSKFFFLLLLAAAIVMLVGPSHLLRVKTGQPGLGESEDS
jgi:hypothetical protein